MILESITYYPKGNVKFTRAEVDTLFECSQSHYDGKCASFSDAGGLLYGLRNEFNLADVPPEYVERRLDAHEIDLLCKIAESPFCSRALYWEISALFKAINEAFLTANKDSR